MLSEGVQGGEHDRHDGTGRWPGRARPWHRHLGQLEHDVPAVAHDPVSLEEQADTIAVARWVFHVKISWTPTVELVDDSFNVGLR